MEVVGLKTIAAISQNSLNVPKTPLTSTSIQSVLQVVFGFAGAIAFLVIVFGGFKYVMSQGNPQETAKAKNTIIYALAGLAVTILAYSIVGFVVGHT